jgi:hypothetical protein
MIIRILSRLLGRGPVTFPERSALDEEGLRLGAALAVIKQRGDLMDVAGSRTDTLALVTTAVKRGLIAWDLSRERYDLTALGETHLEAHRPSAAAPPSPDPSAASSAAATAGAVIAVAATTLGAVAAAVRRTIGARSRHLLSGKGVTAVAGACAIVGMIIGASIGSTRLDDRTARSGVPPKAADASASVPAATAPRTDDGSAGPTAVVEQRPQPDQQERPPVELSDDHGAVVLAGGTARGGQALAGGEADAAAPPERAAKPVVESSNKAANSAAPAAGERRTSATPEPVTPQTHVHVAARGGDRTAVPPAGGRRTAQETARQAEPRRQPPPREPAASDRTTVVDQRSPPARQDGPPARLAEDHGAVAPAAGTARVEADAAAPRATTKPVVESSNKAADDAAPAADARRTAAQPVTPQTHLAARPLQQSAASPERDAPARIAHASGATASDSARRRALEKIMAALGRHRTAAAGEGPLDDTRALSLQEAQPVDHRRPPGRAGRPAAKDIDAGPRARPPIAAAEPPMPAQAGLHNRQAAAVSADHDPTGRDSAGRDSAGRDPRTAWANRAASDEWTRWPQPNDDCDVADAALGPYGWYARPFWPGVVLRRYAPYGRYADGRLAEDRRLHLVYPPAWQYR